MDEFFVEININKLKPIIADRKKKPVAMIVCDKEGLFTVTITVRQDMKYGIVKKTGSRHFKQISSLLVMLRDCGIDEVEITGISNMEDDQITKVRKAREAKNKTS